MPKVTFDVKEKRKHEGNSVTVTLTLAEDAPAELHFSNGERSIEQNFSHEDEEILKSLRKESRDNELNSLKTQAEDLGLGRKFKVVTTELTKTLTGETD